jgi:hypothetical protein
MGGRLGADVAALGPLYRRCCEGGYVFWWPEGVTALDRFSDWFLSLRIMSLANHNVLI